MIEPFTVVSLVPEHRLHRSRFEQPPPQARPQEVTAPHLVIDPHPSSPLASGTCVPRPTFELHTAFLSLFCTSPFKSKSDA